MHKKKSILEIYCYYCGSELLKFDNFNPWFKIAELPVLKGHYCCGICESLAGDLLESAKSKITKE